MYLQCFDLIEQTTVKVKVFMLQNIMIVIVRIFNDQIETKTIEPVIKIKLYLQTATSTIDRRLALNDITLACRR